MELNTLGAAIEAFFQNDATVARDLLSAYVSEHPRDEKGWFWMSRVAERPGDKRACLKRLHELRFARA